MAARFTKDDRTHFVQSVAAGHVETIRNMLASGMPADTSSHVATALSQAAAKGHIEMMELLVSAGAKINARIPVGVDHHAYGTALNTAAALGRVESVRWLLAHGANPKMLDPVKRPPTILLFQNLIHYQTASATAEEIVETLEEILDHGAPVNARTPKGDSLLHLAACNEQIPLAAIPMLLSRGADATALDSLGKTAVHGAAEKKLENRLVALLDNGCDINAQDADGRTLLHNCADEAILDLIYKYSPNTEVGDDAGRTPLLHWVDQIKDPDHVPYPVTRLLQARASLDAPDFEGITPRDVVKAKKLKAVMAVAAAAQARQAMGEAILSARRTAPTKR